MLELFIMFLMALNAISSPSDFNKLSEESKEKYQIEFSYTKNKDGIIIDDVSN